MIFSAGFTSRSLIKFGVRPSSPAASAPAGSVQQRVARTGEPPSQKKGYEDGYINGYALGYFDGYEKADPKKIIIATVTAYCFCKKCCGDWSDGFYANGDTVGGKAIAADLSLFPFGTEINIPGYGIAEVKDCGSAIKGNKFDVYFNTHKEAEIWGVQILEVGIIEKD